MENNGKTVKCNACVHCWCFFPIFSIGMKAQTGKYKIKFKIDEIFTGMPNLNIIGIISQHSKNNQTIRTDMYNNMYNSTLRWDRELHDYIGWGSDGWKEHLHGVYCGCSWDENSCKNNIFRKNSFVYCNNNGNYKRGLPCWRQGDILVLEYNSDLSILSFSKGNDNGKLNADIKHLPKELTFYWFVGHHWDQMSLT